ncbi:MAG: ribose-phosphate pyrophosphokinase [Lachnospiraceae bacterium]|nr:ribose-phosphate pyrophosphokinase [Lachnospiraceae bacterium]
MEFQTGYERNLESIPVGDLGIIALKSCEELGRKINDHIVDWRSERVHEHQDSPLLEGYDKDSYLVSTDLPRFGSGEGKGQINDSVRGKDIYILVDVCNYSLTYSLNGYTNRMSPDDHYQDLKRIIAAIGGKARRVNVIMPFLYESRQFTRTGRESLDCGLALQELVKMGVENIITFDAHDPRVQNAIPLHGFENILPVYQFIKGLFRAVPDLEIDPERLMIISPDEGAAGRAIYMANLLGVDMGMFYKRRDYARMVDGKHPVVAHEFLGRDLSGKDVVLLDDMIVSGKSMLAAAKQLKIRKANRVLICSTFGLFTKSLDKFDKAWKEGLFDALVTTNLVYQPPELLSKPYYTGCDLSKYIALIIDTLNHDGSVSDLLTPTGRINKFLAAHKK